MRIIPIVSAVLAAVGGGGTVAWAQGVGGGSPTHTIHSLELVPTIPEAHHTWGGLVGSEGSPLGVTLDPTGLVWEKEFHLDTTILPHMSPQQVSRIGEYFTVQGDLPWTGWSIEIATQDFAWFPRSSGGVFRVSMDTGGGFTSVPGLQSSFDQSRLDFSFEPLPIGAHVRIGIDVIYMGTGRFTGNLQLRQYPVPEPVSALLLMSFLALTRFRRR